MVTRREFLTAVAVSYAGSTNAWPAAGSEPAARRAGPFSPAADRAMQFGYAAITWGPDIVKAMEDISAVGFKAIQLRGEAFAQFGDRPKELRSLLDKHKLAFAVLSSGNLSIDPAREQEMLSLHVKHAQFVRDAGGKTLQVIDERPKRAVVADDYRRLGRLLTELGKRTADLGVPMVYHHHMNSTGEKPPEVRAVLDAADRRYVRLLFDVAHYQQGGGDPVAAIREYRDWIDVVHLKDVRDGRRWGRFEPTSSSSWGAGGSTCRACLQRSTTSRSTSGRSSSSIASPIRAGRRRKRRR